MPFSESVREKAFQRAGGRCECTREHAGISSAPHHGSKPPTAVNGHCPRGFPEVWGWELNHIVPENKGGKSALENSEVLCTECYLLVHASPLVMSK